METQFKACTLARLGKATPRVISNFLGNPVHRASTILILGVLGLVFAGVSLLSLEGSVFLLDSNIHAGSVRRNSRIATKIRILNLSLHQVSLLIYPSCGCTSVPSEVNILYPLHLATIPVSIDISHQRIGPHSKNVALYFKDSGPIWGRQVTISYQMN